jgi:hypothetical protein
VTFTKKQTEEDLATIRNFLTVHCDGHTILEQVPRERRKVHLNEGGIFEFSIKELLELYAKQKGVDVSVLQKGWGLIEKNIFH